MVAQAGNALIDNRERVKIMEEHLKNVRQEVGHTNALMAAKKKEIATEEHLCALAAREAGRYGGAAMNGGGFVNTLTPLYNVRRGTAVAFSRRLLNMSSVDRRF